MNAKILNKVFHFKLDNCPILKTAKKAGKNDLIVICEGILYDVTKEPSIYHCFAYGNVKLKTN